MAHAVEFCDDTVLGVPFSVVDYVEGTVIRTTAQPHALPDADIGRCAYGLIDVLLPSWHHGNAVLEWPLA